MVVVDGRGLPLGNYLHSASPAEVKLAETTLATIRVGRSHHSGRPRQKPMRVIADKAYDSDPLRERLRQRGIELICPHKKNRVRPATQDGRVLRRYQRRWIVERTNAWLGNFRRLVVRYDRSLTIYGAFFHIACFMIVLRRGCAIASRFLGKSKLKRKSNEKCDLRNQHYPRWLLRPHQNNC
jgi:transposase